MDPRTGLCYVVAQQESYVDDLKSRIDKTSADYQAAVKVVDQILEDPNRRGYLIDLVFLVFQRYGTGSHPQDVLALLIDEDE